MMIYSQHHYWNKNQTQNMIAQIRNRANLIFVCLKLLLGQKQPKREKHDKFKHCRMKVFLLFYSFSAEL